MFEKAKFGTPFLTRSGIEVFYIKKDDKMHRHLIAHPELGALVVSDTGKSVSETVDDPDDIVSQKTKKK